MRHRVGMHQGASRRVGSRRSALVSAISAVAIALFACLACNEVLGNAPRGFEPDEPARTDAGGVTPGDAGAPPLDTAQDATAPEASVANQPPGAGVDAAAAGTVDASVRAVDGGGSCGAATTCDGGCVDTQQDPQNCGSCGHGCGGGACMLGRCQPVLLASNVSATRIAVSSSMVYWVTAPAPANGAGALLGSVGAVPIAGGTPVTLATQQNQPHAITVDAQNVYWTTLGALMKLPLAGGTPDRFANPPAPQEIVAYVAFVYFTDLSAGTVNRALISNGSVDLLASDVIRPSGIAVNAENVFFTVNESTSGSTNAVMSIPLSGGTPTPVATAQMGTDLLALDANNLYWGNVPAGGTGGIMAYSLAAQTTTRLAPGDPLALALDGTDIYWNDLTAGALMRAPLGGGSASLFASSAAVDVKVDGVNVYFCDAGGSVWKVAK